jgi:hypothetical protein
MGPDAFFALLGAVLGLVTFLIFVGIFVRLGRLVRLVAAASDLNLEAHAKLLNALSAQQESER